MVYMNTLLVTHDSTCNYYTTANGYCQLARFSYSSSNFRGSSNDATVFQLKKSINLYDLMSSASGSNGDCYNHGKHQLTYSGQSVRIYYWPIFQCLLHCLRFQHCHCHTYHYLNQSCPGCLPPPLAYDQSPHLF